MTNKQCTKIPFFGWKEDRIKIDESEKERERIDVRSYCKNVFLDAWGASTGFVWLKAPACTIL